MRNHPIMKTVSLFLLIFLVYSCIPLRIAPNIKDDEVMLAKKFKRQLPKNYALIFEDSKEADEFYNYITIKFELQDIGIDGGIPLKINNEDFNLSFYEVEIPTKTLNLIPLAIDAKRESNGNDPLFEEAHVSRVGNWYLVLTVFDKDGNDCLKPEYKDRNEVVSYLKGLKMEYLGSSNYYDALFTKKSPED